MLTVIITVYYHHWPNKDNDTTPTGAVAHINTSLSTTRSLPRVAMAPIPLSQASPEHLQRSSVTDQEATSKPDTCQIKDFVHMVFLWNQFTKCYSIMDSLD